MVTESIEDLEVLSEVEEKNIEKYSEQFENLFNGEGRVDWKKVSDTKNLISYHEGRKSIIDEMLSEKQSNGTANA